MQKSGIVVCGCGYGGSHIAPNMAALSALYGVADTHAAGAVVTKEVTAHALEPSHPARPAGWVRHRGEALPESLICLRDGRRYRVNAQGELEFLPEVPAHG